jgi:hypothetical protein
MCVSHNMDTAGHIPDQLSFMSNLGGWAERMIDSFLVLAYL